MTFAAARSLAPHLEATVVPPKDIDAAKEEILQRLNQYSPRIEPGTAEPGVFWLDPNGLLPLYSSLEAWASLVRDGLHQLGFEASVVVGFHRYRTYALARSGRLRAHPHAPTTLAWVLPERATETRLAATVPLVNLALSPELRDRLSLLGIHRLGQFLSLPAAELKARLGHEAFELHALASDRWVPLEPRVFTSPIVSEFAIDPPDEHSTQVLFLLKGTLKTLMGQLADRGEAMSALRLQLQLDHAPPHEAGIEPARPTLEIPLIIDLVRLRLDALILPAPITGVRIELEGVPAHQEQLALFRTQTRRDLEAAERSLARLKAWLGPQAVTRARLRAAHLPEASFEWEAVQQAVFPEDPSPMEELAPLCRRVLSKPVPLPFKLQPPCGVKRPRHEPEAHSAPKGREALQGPYRVSGGWWVRTVERDYYYTETQQGAISWIYYDHPRRRWFLHGTVD